MHQKLAAVTRELWGVDIDASGVSFLRSQGFDNVIVGDVCELDKIEPLQGRKFDVIVASEVIEHLQNPGLLLDTVKTVMTPGETELIVTVPNAFRVDTLIWLLRGVEYVHPDHNYWFSYLTATNLIRKGGFEIERVYVYSFQPLGVFPNVFGRFFKKAGTGEIATKAANGPALPAPLLQRSWMYFRSLPRRLLTSLLYRRTPFWGDGLIITARLSANAK
jgi:SAM-dependent methyltransferase